MQPDNILDLAINTSVYAGREIMRIYNDPSQDFGIEMKADNSPLTLADKASHNCIVERLKPAGYPILSEEGAQIPFEERKDLHRLWTAPRSSSSEMANLRSILPSSKMENPFWASFSRLHLALFMAEL